jgi:hypothetical protein
MASPLIPINYRGFNVLQISHSLPGSYYEPDGSRPQPVTLRLSVPF